MSKFEIMIQTEQSFGYRMHVSKEMMADPVFLEGYVMKEMRRAFEKEGQEIKLWYYTFRDDGWRKNMVSLEAFNQYHTSPLRNALLLTALEEDLDEAIQWVRDNNPHIHFIREAEKGYNNDDFVYLQKSAILIFEPCA